ncbi:MAG: MFS transporter [Myxococcota bacterium]|jgi:POT family proton-dependent oligopeptide transporter|nr:MFS transporter [Myxococcota bacterium]
MDLVAKTEPDHDLTGYPPGVPYIIANEGCERFSFYGMKTILQVHLTTLFVAVGAANTVLAEEEAQKVVHLFIAAVYAFPMIGAIIADRLLGKYQTIIWLSLLYCAGHGVLAVAENSLPGMYLGLALIAVGAGGIKPCVSAHVGDQFGRGNWNLIPRIFQIFYFIINFGSFFATLLIPVLRVRYGTAVAFGLPGVLMLIATIYFWMGRHKFVHVQPRPGGKLGILDTLSGSALFLGLIGLPLFGTAFLTGGEFAVAVVGFTVLGLWIFKIRQRRAQDDGFLAVFLHALGALLSGANKTAKEAALGRGESGIARNSFFADAARRFGSEAAAGPAAVLRIISIFFLVSVFWALFDQHASTWIRQATRMNRDFDILGWSFTVLPSQIGALNPLMVMLLIPINTYFIYPAINRFWPLTALRKMTLGMFAASFAFVTVALIQQTIDGGQNMHVSWQVIPYLIITQAEVMVSITGLEFAYTQAPARMKSTIMGLWLLCVALGNKLVVLLTGFKGLDLADFFWVFAALMAVAGVLFALRARFYETQDYTQ